MRDRLAGKRMGEPKGCGRDRLGPDGNPIRAHTYEHKSLSRSEALEDLSRG